MWYIKGAAPLDRVSRELELELPVKKYDTFAGFVFSILGHIPEDGIWAESEAPELQLSEGLRIKILEIRERRLERALVQSLD